MWSANRWLPNFPRRFPEGFLGGVILGIVNLYFVSIFVKYFTTAGGKRPLQLLIAAGIGINLVVAGLLLIIYYNIMNPISLLAGFTLVLATMCVQGIRMGKS